VDFESTRYYNISLYPWSVILCSNRQTTRRCWPIATVGSCDTGSVAITPYSSDIPYDISDPLLLVLTVTADLSTLAAHCYYGSLTRGSDHSRLYKKKVTTSTETREINFVYRWSPRQCTRCKQVIIWISPTFCEWCGTNRDAQLLCPLVAMGRVISHNDHRYCASE
jgi:hypothetical protein